MIFYKPKQPISPLSGNLDILTTHLAGLPGPVLGHLASRRQQHHHGGRHVHHGRRRRAERLQLRQVILKHRLRSPQDDFSFVRYLEAAPAQVTTGRLQLRQVILKQHRLRSPQDDFSFVRYFENRQIAQFNRRRLAERPASSAMKFNVYQQQHFY